MRIRKWLCNDRGVTATEFALLAPVFVLMIMGFFDLAHREYATAILQGALQKAGRDSTLETGMTSSATIDAAVKAQVKKVVGATATYTSGRLAYSDFSLVGDAEAYTDKAPLNGKYDVGECYQDANGNNQWDADLGKAGQGGAQDVVLYRMTISYPRLFPMAKLLGWSANQTITASTVLRNQPYGDQVITPSVLKCT
jgi:Flp pilus assembly protein TadG